MQNTQMNTIKLEKIKYFQKNAENHLTNHNFDWHNNLCFFIHSDIIPKKGERNVRSFDSMRFGD